MRKGLVSFLNVIESEGETGDENTQLDLDLAGMKLVKKARRKLTAAGRAALSAAAKARWAKAKKAGKSKL
jgi:hypothetical protein